MFENLKNILLSGNIPLGKVVHIGAGLCSELDEYNDLGFTEVHLFEGTPALSQQLVEKAQGMSHVHIHSVVIADGEGKRPFFLMNNPRFNSLVIQKNLSGYYPNLGLVEEEVVQTLPLTQAILQCGLEREKTNVLVIDIQGMALEMLQSVSVETLQTFKWIVAVSADLSEVDRRDIEYALFESCFDLQCEEAMTLPWCRQAFRKNESELSLRIMKLEHELMLTRLEQAEELSQKLVEEKKLIKSEIENLGGKLKESSESFNVMKLDNSRILNELAQAKEENAKLAEKKIMMDAEIEKLVNQVKESNAAKEDLNASGEKKVNQLNSDLNNLQERLKQSEQTNNLNAKLLTKSNLDLEDLRQRYAEKVASEDQLQELISELHEKLEMAANFYHRLQKTHPELLDTWE